MPISPYEFIRYKRLGKSADPKDIKEFIQGYLDASVADYQMSAWLMAVCFNGLSDAELFAYTEALIESGERFDLSEIPGCKVDKHSTGGVGDKVSLVLAPLVASCGVAVPMVSGRGLGHTGGTLDKLASIPGFCTDLSVDEFKRYLSKIGVAMMGQSVDLCPADGRIYALRDVTATVDSIPLIAASISSKKIAEGAQGLVLDAKVGSGAFMKDESKAEELAKTIVCVTGRFGVRTTALLTDMSQPLGRAVGNALEVAEAIDCLKGQGPDDLRKIVLELAAEMLLLAGRKDHEQARKEAEDALERGRALEKFQEMVKMQGGDPGIVDDLSLLPHAAHDIPVLAESNGVVQSVDTYRVGMLAVDLGAGRRHKEDLIDPAVGFTILKKIGDEVKQSEVLATVHASNASKGVRVGNELVNCFKIGDGSPNVPQLITKRIT
ncbi:thymidine phosphorylase [candidate division TA06 bacterium B3_TA06]|uniref:Thymidine phosphorylase n=1 Tax=candidate division TA06 bacterium B3_TA06 TaxID=2012487 RepID=A0A532V441_UNCT6|nr:MAG: thymidine phosphorylase [candidate division TA06 bacterium B3_TA06]